VTDADRSRLVVERIDKLSRRPWPFVTGILEGQPLTIGQHVTIRRGDEAPVSATIRAIELHTAPGATTVAVDVAPDQITVGSVLSADPT
jgi:hypothetical protein